MVIAAPILRPSRPLRRLAVLALGAVATLAPASDDLALLSDEFESGASIFGWQRLHLVEGWNADQLARWEVNTVRTGAMTMVPYTSTWYQDWRGVLAFKEVTGDFIATTEVHPSNRAGDGPPARSFSLAGILTRTPRPAVTSPQTWSSGGENYVFLSLGSADAPGTYQFEVKTTTDSNSNLEISDGVPSAQIRVVRIGPTLLMLLRPTGGDWIVHRRYRRPDMPATLQVGMTVYTDWSNVASIDPLEHNQTVNTGGQPDLVAHFDFFRYRRPTVPAALAGLDLADPAQVSDAELLAFLGFDSTPNGPTPPTRLNHAGRPLPPAPTVTQPLLFNTAEADAVMAGTQLFPRTHPWNERIDQRPVRADSAAIIAQIKADLQSSRQTLRPFFEMNYVLVPADQPPTPIEFLLYGDESDPSPYPIPDNVPVEGWPRQTGALSLLDWQIDAQDEGGDRHAIIVQPATGGLWETWQMRLVGGAWQASNGARFDLRTNAQRPAGWTSADAAGLSMLGGLVRYDECARGAVEHALRLIVQRTRREYLYPATHYASSSTLATRPAMGQRLRLRADFSVPENWTIHERAVVQALKTYGAIVADNGNFFSISIAPDDRFPDGAFDHLTTIDVDAFEVVETTGPAEGPRSPGMPFVSAGPDRAVLTGLPFTLQGQWLDPDDAPALAWTQLSGPAPLDLTTTTSATPTLQVPAPGTYLLRFAADDGVHTPAFDLVTIEAFDTPPAPAGAFHPAPAGGLTFEFVRPRFPAGFTLEAERSSDLQTWSPATAHTSLLSEDEETVQVGPLSTTDSLFLRVRPTIGGE